jgi:hypothetical protein
VSLQVDARGVISKPLQRKELHHDTLPMPHSDAGSSSLLLSSSSSSSSVSSQTRFAHLHAQRVTLSRVYIMHYTKTPSMLEKTSARLSKHEPLANSQSP